MNSKPSSTWVCYRCRHEHMDKNWNSQRRIKPSRTDRVLRVFTRGGAFLLAWFLAILISRYDPAWNKRSSQPKERGKLPSANFRLPKPSDAPNIPLWITHPPPAIFAIAWAVFALSAAAIYHFQRHDQLQNHILSITIASGILGGFFISERSLVGVLGMYLPLCVSLGLLFSALFHGLRKPRSADMGEEERQVDELVWEKE